MPDVERGLREKTAYRQRMDSFLARSQEPTAPYTTTVLGREFVVLPTVFSLTTTARPPSTPSR